MPTASPIEYCRPLLERPGRQMPWCQLRRLQKKPTKSKIRIEPEHVRGENLYKPHRAASHQPPATGRQRNKSQSVA